MKWLQVCLLVALVAASSTMELGYRKPRIPKLPRIFEDKILELINEYIKNGIPALGVPPLDPLELPQEVSAPRVSYHDVVVIDKLMIRGTRVDGIGTFTNNKIALELAGFTGFDLEIDLSWPSLKAKGEHYEFLASLVGILELNGAGAYEVELKDVRGRVKVSIRSGDDSYLYVSAVELGPLTFSELNNNLEGLIEPGHVSDVINEAVHLLAKRVWDKAEPAVAIMAEQLAKQLANQELAERKITMEDVMEWISNQP